MNMAGTVRVSSSSSGLSASSFGSTSMFTPTMPVQRSPKGAITASRACGTTALPGR